jgi:hypothetical protein
MTCPSELTPYVASDIVEQVSSRLAGPVRMMELLAEDDFDNADLFYMISGVLQDQINTLDMLAVNLMAAQGLMERAKSK